MPKLTPTLLILLILAGCKPKTGEVSGNVYWNYNKFVGNKPDAGSNVFLLSSDTTQPAITAKCDVQGNFSFQKVKEGKYLLLVVSQNTTADGYENFSALDEAPVKDYTGIDVKSLNKPLYDSIQYYDNLYTKIVSAPMGTTLEAMTDQVNQTDLYKSKRNVFSDSLVETIKGTRLNKISTNLGKYGPKIKMYSIDVKEEKPVSQVVDFGTTYL